jgi:hypothetical protein
MCSHNEIIEHFYFKYFIAGSKVIGVQRYRSVQVRAVIATNSYRSEDIA